MRATACSNPAARSCRSSQSCRVPRRTPSLSSTGVRGSSAASSSNRARAPASSSMSKNSNTAIRPATRRHTAHSSQLTNEPSADVPRCTNDDIAVSPRTSSVRNSAVTSGTASTRLCCWARKPSRSAGGSGSIRWSVSCSPGSMTSANASQSRRVRAPDQIAEATDHVGVGRALARDVAVLQLLERAGEVVVVEVGEEHGPAGVVHLHQDQVRQLEALRRGPDRPRRARAGRRGPRAAPSVQAENVSARRRERVRRTRRGRGRPARRRRTADRRA